MSDQWSQPWHLIYIYLEYNNNIIEYHLKKTKFGRNKPWPPKNTTGSPLDLRHPMLPDPTWPNEPVGNPKSWLHRDTPTVEYGYNME